MLTQYLPLLLSALAFVFSVFSFFYFRADIRARTSEERFLSELREEVNSILKSINETTDRDISLIEEREKNLRKLLEEVEKRLKVYIREVEVRREAENAYRELGKNRYRFPQDLRSKSDSRSESDSRKSDSRGESETRDEAESHGELKTRDETAARPDVQQEAALHVNSAPAYPIPEFRIKPQSAQDKPPENPLTMGEQIHSLVRAGFSVPVIASRLGISIAEVEFAAALLERRDIE